MTNLEKQDLFGTTVETERLEKLANHLINGDFGNDGFNYSCIRKQSSKIRYCGYVGCAIGECMFVFPKDWRKDKNNGVLLRGKNTTGNALNDAAKFFGLSDMACTILFAAHNYKGTNSFIFYELKQLKFVPIWTDVMRDVVASDVAKNILRFVELHKEWLSQQEKQSE